MASTAANAIHGLGSFIHDATIFNKLRRPLDYGGSTRYDTLDGQGLYRPCGAARWEALGLVPGTWHPRGQRLYLPAHFEENRIGVLHALMRARPLATLVTQCDSGLEANHVPVETLSEPLPHGTIQGHIARANPLWRSYRAESQALAIFQGPQVYISPSFYPSKQATGEVVPTWDYAVVHARGVLRVVQDDTWLRALVARLTDAHEAARRLPWKIDDAPPPYIEKMLSLIVGFEFSIISLTGKWKLSQNHPAANRRGVMAGLRTADGEDSRQVADMLESLEKERANEPQG